MVPKGEPGEGSSLPQRSDHFADFAVSSSAALRSAVNPYPLAFTFPPYNRVKHSRRDPDSSGRSLIKAQGARASRHQQLAGCGSLRQLAAACGSPRPLLEWGNIRTIGTAIQHDTILQCSQITQKCRSLTFHIHIHNGTGTVTPTDHASWPTPSGGTGACPRSEPRVRGT